MLKRPVMSRSSTELSTEDNIPTQILIQVLAACIRQARANESFATFSREQQNRILQHVWFECFILRVANWSIDISSIVERCADEQLRSIVQHTKALRVDLIELSLLETIILCRKEYALSAKEVQQLESTSETALIALGHYSMQQMSIVGPPPLPSAMVSSSLGYPTREIIASASTTDRPLSPMPTPLAVSSIRGIGCTLPSPSSLLPFSCYRLGRLLLGLRGLSMHCYESSVRAMFHEFTGEGLMEHFIIKL
ncbi:uncharacterized protein LOC134227623 [Armigeres subalbatus]|uniref:uncharacterized protein LOC134227623 n=1 Tax=Armigeres subalbatus TaxID=124917 RepID=UPI002ED06AE0